ncbi:uncharacterized protein EDB91DRAFT_207723 [Suillus paluster]|uniref:uncharacterized protein n=1 Tax=Suillus paluster TaxID=48578 RepID=UPI001B879517|nr:uncharacterized protein EDB91DRAFT_207723 [Suillus paluster]KAG1744036.1 hypothetical protein EDB91DRAFT_207723 [Suillus paluster]
MGFPALTFGQEVELIWRQRWSLMTALYLSVRYLGIIYAIIQILVAVPTIPHAYVGVSYRIYFALDWTGVVVHAIIGVVAAFFVKQTSAEALILSGTYQCDVNFVGNALFLDSLTWIFGTVWEVLALCLALWIAVKHFRELRRHSAGGIIGDCFKVLIKSHVVYFASFLAGSCFELVYLFTPISANQYSLETQIYIGVLQIFTLVQMFVLGPRLILSVREYHAELVADSVRTETAMTSIAFQGRAHVSTSRSV